MLPAIFLVFVGGGLGASARFAVNQLALAWLGTGFPWGTMAINVAGSLAIGLAAGLFGTIEAGMGMRLLLVTGFLGGFTTFSAFSLEAVRLVERGAAGAALGYVAASVLGSIAATAAGLWMTRG
jgi:fluoride exporter